MTHAPTIPNRADIVIIGGGIIGSATAFWLARRGLSVMLCEKGRIAGEQSGRNWGWVRRMGRDPAELELASRALDIWPKLGELLGHDTGFSPCGIAYLCQTEADMTRRIDWFRAHAGDAGGDIRALDSRAVSDLFPQSAALWTGALLSPHDGRAEPEAATRAFALAAKGLGAIIMEKCAVRDIETAGGSVCGVITEHGSVKTGAVVLSGGVWSRMMCDRLGIRLPQLGVVNSVLRTAPVENAPDTTASAGTFAFRRSSDGGYVVAHGRYSEVVLTAQHLRFARDFLPALAGEWRDLRPRLVSPLQPWAGLANWKPGRPTPFERVRVLSPVPSRRILDAAMAALANAFPAFANVRVADRWAGVIDVLPDAVPVIDVVNHLPGLVLATGFSGHGFGLGPAAGELAAALACGEAPAVDPAPFRLSRLD